MAQYSDEEVACVAREIQKMLFEANDADKMPALLIKMGLSELIPGRVVLGDNDSRPSGMIMVVGQSEVKAEKLLGALKSELGYYFDRKRFDFRLGYDNKEHADFLQALKGQSKYRAVIVGNMPHKSADIGKNSSALETMRNDPYCYPKVFPLGYNGELVSITKSNFVSKIQELVESGFLDVG